MTALAGGALLSITDLKTHFRFGGRWVGTAGSVRAVDGVTLSINPGEVLGLVGESGSGKTTLGRSILRLIEPTDGSIEFDGIDVRGLSAVEMRGLRKRMQVVFQDPYQSLSPRMQIGQIIAEPLRLHRIVPETQVEDRVIELLGKVGMEPYFRHRYPHEMSGGQRQRIAIARALSLEPDFIVADEPVSALDASVRAQILNVLLALQRSEGITLLLISHDLAVVERVADRIAVMYKGKIVEVTDAHRLVDRPLHPYTQALVSAVPSGVPGQSRPRVVLPTDTSSPTASAQGCPFAPRCAEAQPICRAATPHLQRKDSAHEVACHVR
jgi:oligopeptide/dipeptide ABC transporter ATP-binding protein